ncbi:MAG: MFS transporter [Candidatus Korobacteraceae bacterium]
MKTSTLRRIFKAFHYRDFRLMWVGACTSSIGTWMQIVAQGWLIYRLSHSAFLLAIDQFLGGIPIFLFSLIGGVVADRIERRKVLLASQYVQMASAAILTVLVANGLTHVWPILCLSFMSGLAQAFGGPAYSALIPTLVDREDMPNAIALNSIQFNLAVTIGPALAGQALAKLGEKWCFGLNALSFLAPVISLLMIRTRFLPVSTGDSMFTSLKEGIKFVRKQGSMEALIVLAFCMTALAMPMRTYIPVFVKDIFHRGPETYGNLLSLMGIGSIAGSLLVAGLGNIHHKGRFAISMLICLGAAIAAFSLSKSLPLSYCMLVIVGASMMSVFATVTSLVQLIITNEMRGRVMSVYNCAFRGGMPMGNLLSGWIVPIFTAPVVLSVNGLLLIVMALYFLLVQRRVAAL